MAIFIYLIMWNNIVAYTDSAKVYPFFWIAILCLGIVLKFFYWTLFIYFFPLSPVTCIERNWVDAVLSWYRKDNKNEMLWTEVKKLWFINPALA